jgi:hypothetical protein
MMKDNSICWSAPSPWHVTWPIYGLAAPINTICVQLLHHSLTFKVFFFLARLETLRSTGKTCSRNYRVYQLIIRSDRNSEK